MSSNRAKANKLKREHEAWRDELFAKKEGFFPIFYEFKNYLPHLSGGAVALFVYIGIHANNQSGENFHSLDRVSKFFGKSSRTISTYFKELEEIGLVERFQLDLNGKAHTFIRPYGKLGGDTLEHS